MRFAYWTAQRQIQIQILTLVVFLCVWQGAATLRLADGIIPSLYAVGLALTHFIGDSEFYRHLGTTAYEVLAGFAIACITGVVAGLLMGGHRLTGDVLEPLIGVFAATPKIIFYPVVMLLLGIGMESKIALGALSGFFPIAITTHGGIRHLRPIWVKVGRSFNLNPWQMGTRVYLPALRRPIIGAMRIGLGVTIIGILVAEMKLAEGGLGYLAMEYYGGFEIAKLYALLSVIFVLAALVNSVLRKLGPIDI